MNEFKKTAEQLNAIRNAGISYSFRKYAGAWVPVVVKNGKRYSFNHCATAAGALETALNKAADMAKD